MLNIRPDDPVYNVFQRVLKKHWKFHLVNNKNSVVGNSMSLGTPGAGKTSGNRREVELRYELRHKIFCLYDAGRMDLAYFMFPSNSNFWRIPKIENRKLVSARSYPVELLYPVTSDIPSKLPNNGVAFTIPVSELDDNDITALVGENSRDTVKGVLNYMKRKVDETTTPLDYLNIMGSALKKVEDYDEIKPSHFGVKRLKSDVFLPLFNEGLLSSSTAPTSINLKEKIKDRKTISVLVLRHCPQHLWGFVVYYFLNHIFKLLAGFGEARRVKQKTTIVMNEVADLISTNDDTGSASASISKMIGRIAKQYRTGEMYLLIDTQIPQQLPDIKDTFSRIYVYNSGVVEAQKAMEIMGISSRSGQINADDIMIFPRLPPGYFYLFDRITGVSLHKATWTRSRTYFEGEDFYDVYDRVYGKSTYKDIRGVLRELESLRSSNERVWEDVKKLKRPPAAKKAEVEVDEELVKEEVAEEIIDKKIEKEEAIEMKKEAKKDAEKKSEAVPVEKPPSNWEAKLKLLQSL